MDNEFDKLEAELLQLQPTPPSAQLSERLAQSLNGESGPTPSRSGRRYTTTTSWTSWKWANWAVAAALVALMTVATLTTQQVTEASLTPLIADVSPVNAAELLRPVRAGRILVESRAEGVLELSDGSPVERFRDYFVDTIEWQDAAGRSQLRWEVPRESVRFVALASY